VVTTLDTAVSPCDPDIGERYLHPGGARAAARPDLAAPHALSVRPIELQRRHRAGRVDAPGPVPVAVARTATGLRTTG
jgi:hypothetical protein